MINDIIRQVKSNPNKIPVPAIYKRNIEMVSPKYFYFIL